MEAQQLAAAAASPIALAAAPELIATGTMRVNHHAATPACALRASGAGDEGPLNGTEHFLKEDPAQRVRLRLFSNM